MNIQERKRRNGERNMQNNTDKLYFSRRELAEMFGITTQAVYLWEKAGRLTAVKLGKQTVRYHRDTVQALIAAGSAHAAQ